MIDQIYNANYHPMAGMTSQEVCLFATGKLVNQLIQIFCDSTGYLIYITEYEKTLIRFRLCSYENEKRYFSVVLSDPTFAVNLER